MPLDELEVAFRTQLAETTEFGETVSPGIDGEAPPRATLEIHADPQLLALVHGRFQPDIARTHTLRTFIGELPFHLDPVDWRSGFLEVSDGGPPLDIREGMREAVPQAQLRDLFRPEYSKDPVSLDYVELPLDPGARRAFAELRSMQKLEPIPVIERTANAIMESARERRAFVATPWKPLLSDDQPRREVFVVIEPSLSS